MNNLYCFSYNCNSPLLFSVIFLFSLPRRDFSHGLLSTRQTLPAETAAERENKQRESNDRIPIAADVREHRRSEKRFIVPAAVWSEFGDRIIFIHRFKVRLDYRNKNLILLAVRKSARLLCSRGGLYDAVRGKYIPSRCIFKRP